MSSIHSSRQTSLWSSFHGEAYSQNSLSKDSWWAIHEWFGWISSGWKKLFFSRARRSRCLLFRSRGLPKSRRRRKQLVRSKLIFAVSKKWNKKRNDGSHVDRPNRLEYWYEWLLTNDSICCYLIVGSAFSFLFSISLPPPSFAALFPPPYFSHSHDHILQPLRLFPPSLFPQPKFPTRFLGKKRFLR